MLGKNKPQPEPKYLQNIFWWRFYHIRKRKQREKILECTLPNTINCQENKN